MPPAFSAEEKARITGELMDAGYRLFTAQGLRKTSLDELVAPAGIAKSSFYAFFDSKEALYLELMLKQTGEVKRAVIDRALLAEEDTGEALRRFLRATLGELTTNPLWRRLMTHPEEMQAVARKLDPERVSAMADNPATALTRYVEEQREAGRLVEADTEVVIGVLQCVLLVPVFGERLGEPALRDRILDFLVDIVADGLTGGKD
ncbi:transcriptional regulator, TetR family [Saccharopolyspora kobensis]|uniref:Transcriptional regulator, TetR family n=1 Tax=Saccharopolyspora kobensis TaxID=146035 RepID=A0A1H6ASK0_9PSEU|nr:TetR/AcrR family transcriptional regulator [Saccharopolyspora kobensis]SEG51045.1 transcriptional regulator, TetR family [Saccharopolyspora kobensis]SFE76942.1 transcriptional regulator, TetR family [Saccharopolyspora kobensis]